MTRRAQSGDPTSTGRRQVGLTVPRRLKEQVRAAAEVMDWSVGDWVLAAAAEFGPRVPSCAEGRMKKRPSVPDATFCALYLTSEERQVLDDQAQRHGLNRSAFVTASAQLALGAHPQEVRRGLEDGDDVPLRPSVASGQPSNAPRGQRGQGEADRHTPTSPISIRDNADYAEKHGRRAASES